MKTFTVEIAYTASATLTIEAESEDEAMHAAYKKAYSEVPYDTLLAQVEDIEEQE